MGGNLHISHLNKEGDVGIYQCLASNSFGTIVSREASLHIACKSILYSTIQSVIIMCIIMCNINTDNIMVICMWKVYIVGNV